MSHHCCNPSDVHAHANTLPVALRMAEIFCPDTVLIDGRVYFEAPDADDYAELMDFADQDPITVQVLLNHRHIQDLYAEASDATANEAESATREQLIAFGAKLQQCWQALMHARYPTLAVTVVFDAQDEDTAEELQIIIYQDDEAST